MIQCCRRSQKLLAISIVIKYHKMRVKGAAIVDVIVEGWKGSIFSALDKVGDLISNVVEG